MSLTYYDVSRCLPGRVAQHGSLFRDLNLSAGSAKYDAVVLTSCSRIQHVLYLASESETTSDAEQITND